MSAKKYKGKSKELWQHSHNLSETNIQMANHAAKTSASTTATAVGTTDAAVSATAKAIGTADAAVSATNIAIGAADAAVSATAKAVNANAVLVKTNAKLVDKFIDAVARMDKLHTENNDLSEAPIQGQGTWAYENAQFRPHMEKENIFFTDLTQKSPASMLGSLLQTDVQCQEYKKIKEVLEKEEGFNYPPILNGPSLAG